jgi:hypothetical protein
MGLFYILFIVKKERREKLMSKLNISQFFKTAQKEIVKHSPEILTGLGIVGFITTTVLAVKATPKALELIEDKKNELEVDKLTPIETVKTTWKCYVPMGVSGVTSIACVLGAHSVHARRNAALATAYKLSETAFLEYQQKVVETIGDKKEKLIKEAIDKDHLEKNPVSSSEIIVTGKGTTRFYDMHSGRYFESTIDLLDKAVNNINREMLLHDYISLNEFYDELDLPRTNLGDDLGWSIDKGYVEIRRTPHLSEDDVPCIAISYNIAPRRDFSKYL